MWSHRGDGMLALMQGGMMFSYQELVGLHWGFLVKSKFCISKGNVVALAVWDISKGYATCGH